MRVKFLALTMLVLATALVVSTISCGQAVEGKIGVVVSILPLADFVESVGGDKVEITVMVPPGASPHTYELKPSQLVKVEQAGMYVKVGSGVEFELVWMEKIIERNPDMSICDTSQEIELMGKDPHIWNSPLNAKVMVENICTCLITVDPENEEYYVQKRKEYLEKLDELDQYLKEGFAGIESRAFMVYHSAWGYFAREYNLEQIKIEREGKEPTAREIQEAVETALAYGIEVIFASPQFSAESAWVIAREIDGQVIFIDPLPRNYIWNMLTVAGKLAVAMIMNE